MGTLSPALRIVVVVLCVALVLSAGVFGYQLWQRHRAETSAEAIIERRAIAQRASDSLYFFRQGQHYEVQRQLDSLSHHAESAPFPAGFVLPEHPPRQ